MKLVLIRWIDSVRDIDGWEFKKDIDYSDTADKLMHESVGWMIEKNKDFVSLAHSRSTFVYDDGDVSLIRSITIPKVAIINIKDL